MTATRDATLAVYDAAAGRRQRAQRREITGLLVTSPFWIGFVLFGLAPMAASLYFSFTHFDALTPPQWIGLKNYIEMVDDKALLRATWNTLVLMLVSVPLGVFLSMLLAILLNQKVKFLSLWRTIYYLPAVIPVVSMAVLWRWLLNTDFGILNAALSFFRIPKVNWLGDPEMILVAYVIMGLFGLGGGLIINLAALQNIPTDLYDAAKVDGAGRWATFRAVTLPMVSPVLFYSLIMGMVSHMQSFAFYFVLTQGWGNVSYTDIGTVYAVHLYRVAFQLYRLGYASAMAWMLFLAILVLTLLVTRVSRNLVYYEGEWLTGR